MLTRQRQRWERRVLYGNRTAYAKALWQREHRWEASKKGLILTGTENKRVVDKGKGVEEQVK